MQQASVQSVAADEPEDPEDVDPGVDDRIDPAPVTPTTCVVTPGTWTWTRTDGMCLSAQKVTCALYDENGKQVGQGVMKVGSTLHAHWNRTDVEEQITVKVIGAT
ncbi:hypothetical protein [Streptomyces sp. NPDC001315]|uniref:hypothetical protein n=1 Tax=Streptomyces sp. NPDC001315 TaxID=3364562 RepID=UPI00368F6FA0